MCKVICKVTFCAIHLGVIASLVEEKRVLNKQDFVYGLLTGDQSSHTIHKVRIYYRNNGVSVYLSSFAILLCTMERHSANLFQWSGLRGEGGGGGMAVIYVA